jgi:hypothetical protein
MEPYPPSQIDEDKSERELVHGLIGHITVDVVD